MTQISARFGRSGGGGMRPSKKNLKPLPLSSVWKWSWCIPHRPSRTWEAQLHTIIATGWPCTRILRRLNIGGKRWRRYWKSQEQRCSAVTGNDIKGSVSEGVSFLEWDLGVDRNHVEGYIGFSSSGGQENCGKDSSKFWGQRVGMTTNGRSPGCVRYMDHQIIHSETAGYHRGANFQPAHIWTIHGDRQDVEIQQIHQVVGSSCATGGRVTRRILRFKIIV